MTSGPQAVAVIGMSGRFPMSNDVDEYWRNLCSGRECITFSSDGDDLSRPAAPAAVGEPHFVAAGGVFDGIDLFDAQFFGFSAKDAEGMDPQHRIFLECAWDSLERAGYNPDAYPGLIGLYAGSAMSFYLSDLYANEEVVNSFDEYGLAIGNDKDHLTTQVSYRLNLRGPSVTVQTACSTSLVSVCMACQGLLNYQCDIALAGGVAADMATGQGYYYQPGAIFSPDGHCRPFDEAAAGTVAGNGVGVVVLKRLSDALNDRDHIHAVIKGFGVNNDGSRKVGYTAPSVDGQAEVIAMAQAMAGVEPGTIGYVEAHGTATPLGDPIELAALNQVFRAGTSRKHFCAIGSVKSNIGHLDTAAGVASFIKTVLALEHRLLPPSLHYTRPNPRIDPDNSAFYVNTTLTEWKACNVPRRAGVSSFGIGGTNAHVVLEESPRTDVYEHARPYSLLTLSARTPQALERLTDDLANHLADHQDIDLADVAYTHTVGRKAFDHRRVAVVERHDVPRASEILRQREPSCVLSGECNDLRGAQVVFLFPGQGTQVVDMGVEAYKHEPTFRSHVDRCCELLLPHLGLDLRSFIYPTAQRQEQAQERLDQTALSQPALFVVEYALAQLWSEWGIAPDAMIGHSLGEYVAACVAEVFTLEDALAVVAERGRLMQLAEPGAMLAVPLPEHVVTPYFGDELSLAAVNGPAACVVSGSRDAVKDLAARLSARGVDSRTLRTSHAYHSALMDSAVEPFVDKMRTVRLKPPKLPYLSNLTGGWITPAAATDPHYWGMHLRRTVRFSDELEELFRHADAAVLLEVGPGQTLSDLARHHPHRGSTHALVTSLGSRGRQPDGLACLLKARGTLWLNGIEGSPDGLFLHERRRRVPLPTYPFERERYWVDAGLEREESGTGEPRQAPREGAESFYRLVWQPATPRATLVSTRRTSGPRRWLVLHNGSPFDVQVVQRLRELDREVDTVRHGKTCETLDSSCLTVRVAYQEDYSRLLTTLAEQGRMPNAILHLWNVTDADTDPTSTGALRTFSQIGFLSLVYLAQALSRIDAHGRTHVDVVTNHLHDVVGDEWLNPAKATLLGACRVIPQEHPGITCRAIDIDVDVPSRAVSWDSVTALVTELTEAPYEPVVAHRRGRRWMPAFEMVQMGSPSARPRTRPDGVYLITGGLGDVGRVHAEHIARIGSPKLVLTGRSKLPESDQWQAVAAAQPESRIATRIRSILHLRKRGANVAYFCADTADRDAMAAVVASVQERFGPINGIIHAAADTDAFAPISETDGTITDRLLRGKAAGAAVLAELIRETSLGGEQLDFCMMLSSLSSILGGPGQGAYAAANCYLDAMVAAQNRSGSVPWIGVNWDAWRFGDTVGGIRDSVTAGIVPSRGEQLLRQILASAPRQVAVCVGDLDEQYDWWVRQQFDALADVSTDSTADLQMSSTAQSPVHTRPALKDPYLAPRTADEKALVTIWEGLLGVAPIGVLDSFLDLGGHSLLAIQLVSRIRQELGMECRVQHIFDAPTIAEFAKAIAAENEVAEPELDAAQLLTLVEQLSDDDARSLLSLGDLDGRQPRHADEEDRFAIERMTHRDAEEVGTEGHV
jgi:acyl transferase domain-containing protein/acyl carrier protein